MSHAPVPASQMLSLQQVEAQQAAQQLLQGQQQKAPLPADNGAFGAVLRAPDAVETASADAAEEVRWFATHQSSQKKLL